MIVDIAVILLRLLFSGEPEVDVQIAASQAWTESRYEPTAVSRLVDGRREGGTWDGPFPEHWKGPYFCGLWQTRAVTEAECIAQRNIVVAWRARRHGLKSWLRFCHGDIRCALNGYGCGVKGARAGRCNNYAERILQRARKPQT